MEIGDEEKKEEMEMLSSIYADPAAATHGIEYCAYYAGRGSIWYGVPKAPREAFKSESDYQAYLRGRRHAASEDRLDADTEWD